MMKLGFYQFSKAWYSKIIAKPDFIDEIMIGNYDTNGVCEYEFKIEWIKLRGDVVPKLIVYDDAWKGFFKNHQDFAKLMCEHNGKNITPDQMFEMLIGMAYQDFTPYTMD